MFLLIAPDDKGTPVLLLNLKKLVGAGGSFVLKKHTILAFKKALEEIPDAKLIIGGYRPLFNTCKNLIKYEKLEKYYTYRVIN